jgi:hypothetical protein
VRIVDANGNVIAEVASEFATQVLEALPEGSHVPGGMEDMLPEGVEEPSADERRYYGDDVDEREDADERRWQEEDMGDSIDQIIESPDITWKGDKVQKKLDDNRLRYQHKIRLRELKKALEREQEKDKALEREQEKDMGE